MSTRNKTRSALRAALKHEDAALTERIPDAETAAVSVETEEEPVGNGAQAPAAELVSIETAPAKTPAAPKRGTKAPAKASTTPVKATAKAPAKAGTKPNAKAASATAEAGTSAPAAAAEGEPTPVPAKKASRKSAAKAAPAAVAAPAAKKAEAKRETEDAERAKKQKSEKVVRDSFSMPASEHTSIKSLRIALGKAGRLASKSEVLRAGLKLLSERDVAEVLTLVDSLPVAEKGKRKKH